MVARHGLAGDGEWLATRPVEPPQDREQHQGTRPARMTEQFIDYVPEQDHAALAVAGPVLAGLFIVPSAACRLLDLGGGESGRKIFLVEAVCGRDQCITSIDVAGYQLEVAEQGIVALALGYRSGKARIAVVVAWGSKSLAAERRQAFEVVP